MIVIFAVIETLNPNREVYGFRNDLGGAIKADPSRPALLVILSKGARPGETIWLAGGGSKIIAQSSAGPLELLRFDFLTAPAKADQNKP